MQMEIEDSARLLLPEAAAQAGLRYVSEDEPGFRRLRWGRGFRYLDPAGQPVQGAHQRSRFETLAIPPAWTEVWICPDEGGHIQVTGRDAKGRKQYIYHPDWDALRNQAKFERIALFGEALPALRARVEVELGGRALSREKVTAMVVSLLDSTLIRVGNAEYARQNESYGLTTLQSQHLEISGARLRFSFRGKSGKQHDVDLIDRRLARMIKRCQELPGQALFQYRDEAGNLQSVRSDEVNCFLRETTGQDFTAKDFRTWGGSVLMAAELYRMGPRDSQKSGEKAIVLAIKTVSKILGNTPAVCRKYYVHPFILQSYLSGELFGAMERGEAGDGLSRDERAVLDLIR